MAVISILWKTLKYLFVAVFVILFCWLMISYLNTKNKVSAWSTQPPACTWSGDNFPDGNWRQAVQDKYSEPTGSPYGSLSGNVRPSDVWTDSYYVIGRTTGFDDNDDQNIQIHIKSSQTTPYDS